MFDQLTRFISQYSKQKPRGAGGPPRRLTLGQSLLRLEPLEDRRMLSATITLQAFPNTSQYGQPVDLRAKVSPAATGSVTFYETAQGASTYGTNSVGTATLNQRGVATLNIETSPLPAGADEIWAVYTPSGGTAISATAAITVNAAATSTTVHASPDPGVGGSSVTFTAVVADAAPNWANNGGTITPPSGTLNFLINGQSETGTFVGDNGTSAIYTYTVTADSASGTAATSTAPVIVGANSVSATFVPASDSDYLGSTSRTKVNYQVVAPGNTSGTAGTGTIATSSTSTTATDANTATLKGGQTLTLYYDDSGTTSTTPNSLVYVDANNGIDLTATVASMVTVFGSNGTTAEVSGTGTNGTSATPVNFTLFVNTASGHGFFRQPNVVISIVGSTAVATATGTGLDYNQSGTLASGSTISITNESGGTNLPVDGGLPAATDKLLQSWSSGGGFGLGGGGSGSGGELNFGELGGFFGRRR